VSVGAVTAAAEDPTVEGDQSVGDPSGLAAECAGAVGLGLGGDVAERRTQSGRRIAVDRDFAWLFDWLFACRFAWLFAIRGSGSGRNPHRVGDRGGSILPTFSRSIEVWS
jgi:hypothetical protein